MASLRWTREAESSLREVYEHIARNRPATARRTIESILNKVESLREAPTLGQSYPLYRLPGLRRLTYGQFQIAYLLDGENEGGENEVVILGVFHGLIFLPLQ